MQIWIIKWNKIINLPSTQTRPSLCYTSCPPSRSWSPILVVGLDALDNLQDDGDQVVVEDEEDDDLPPEPVVDVLVRHDVELVVISIVDYHEIANDTDMRHSNKDDDMKDSRPSTVEPSLNHIFESFIKLYERLWFPTVNL